MQVGPNQIWRSCNQTQRFMREMEAIHPNIRRADEYMEGVDQTLARNPREGKPIAEGSEIWYVTDNEHANLPGVILFYKFTDQRVWYLSIKFIRIPF